MHEESLPQDQWSLWQLDGLRFVLFGSRRLQLWDLSSQPWTVQERTDIAASSLVRWWTHRDRCVLAVAGSVPRQIDRKKVDPVRRFRFGELQLVGNMHVCWIEDEQNQRISMPLSVDPNWTWQNVDESGVCVGIRTCVRLWHRIESQWRVVAQDEEGVRDWRIVDSRFLAWTTHDERTHLVELGGGLECWSGPRVLHWIAMGPVGGFLQFMADGTLQRFWGWYTEPLMRWHESSDVRALNGRCFDQVWNENTETWTSVTRSGQWRVHQNSIMNVVASGDARMKWTAYVQLADSRLVFLDNDSCPPRLKIMCFSRRP
jgi:hypothetical protein